MSWICNDFQIGFQSVPQMLVYNEVPSVKTCPWKVPQGSHFCELLITYVCQGIKQAGLPLKDAPSGYIHNTNTLPFLFQGREGQRGPPGASVSTLYFLPSVVDGPRRFLICRWPWE